MRAHLIYNPQAGPRGGEDQVNRVVTYLTDHGWSLDVYNTRVGSDVTRYARKAVASGADAVLVVGGDGTVNGAVNGLAGSDVALGVLPMGTGNVWAAELGLVPVPTPLHRPDLLAAAEALCKGHIRRVDLGRAVGLGDHGESCERYFLLWAGVGFDAAVAREVETAWRETKRYLGAFSFVMAGASTLLRYPGTGANVKIDNEQLTERIVLILVCNIQLYAGMVRVAPEARIDDGWLNVYLFRGRGLGSTLRHLVTMLIHRHRRDPQVRYASARQVTIEALQPLRVQVDGEPMGTTPVHLEVVPGALNIIVPPETPTTLFAHKVRSDV